MLSGVKFRSYPSSALKFVLSQWIGHQRFIKNAKVREFEYWRTFGRHSLALTGQVPFPDQQYAQFINESTAFLREVPSQILRNGAYRFMQANARYLKGLGSAPKVQHKHGRQSVMVTSELFTFEEVTDAKTGEITHKLRLGTRASPIGYLPFHAHRPYSIPAAITISVEPDGAWYVSFACDKPNIPEHDIIRAPEELAYELRSLSKEELLAVTVGGDRGVVIPLAASNGHAFTFPEACQKKLQRKEKYIKRLQRKQARQLTALKARQAAETLRVKNAAKPGMEVTPQPVTAKNYEKTKRKLGAARGYGKNVRKDFAHKTSHTLTSGDERIIALEALKLQNMTRATKPVEDVNKPGRYVRNNAAAKSGLNKALLESGLGLIRQYTTYKAQRKNKLMIFVPPYHSSNECRVCGYTDAMNRPTQEKFHCLACQHTENADFNAAGVIKNRAVDMLLNGEVVFKIPKKVRVRRKNKIDECQEGYSLPGEASVSRSASYASTPLGLTNQENLVVRQDAPSTPCNG